MRPDASVCLPCLVYYQEIYFLLIGTWLQYLNNPVRILRNQVPYKDFWLLFPPGEVLIPALIYKMVWHKHRYSKKYNYYNILLYLSNCVLSRKTAF